MIKNVGVTLLELMIVVAIIGVIAAIGYPSYVEYVREARRADAQGALISFAGAMERHFTTRGNYCDAAQSTGTAVTNCGGTGKDEGKPSIFQTEAPIDGGEAFYDLTIASVSATSFRLDATPKGAQTGDPCGTFRLDHQGNRTVTGSGDCWP